MILTLCRSQQILERFARVQPLFALGAGPSFFTCFIIQMRCNETDKFDCKLVVNQTSFILSSSKAASTRLEERWMDHPDGQLAFNETLLRVFVPHAAFSSWNRDQVIFYRACRFDLMIFIWHKTPTSPQALWTRTLQWKGACNESVAAPFLRWNGGWLRIGNERVAAVKSWLLPYCGWKRRWLHLNGRDQPCFIDKTRAPVLLLSRRGSLFLRGRFSHAYFLETLRGLFDIFIVVVVVCIVIPKKIALRH